MFNYRKLLGGVAAFALTFVAFAQVSEVDVEAATRGVVVGEVVNVRSYSELDDSNRLFQVSRGQAVDIFDVSGDFFRVNVQGESAVYISREWVRVSETQGIVIADSAQVFNKPAELGGQVIGTVSLGNMIPVTSNIDGWYGVNFWGEPAFISRSDMSIPSFVELQTSRIPGDNRRANEIISFAKNYLGTPHVFGANGPHAFDCSGFINYILAPFGIHVNRHSGDIARNGEHVDRNDLLPGDLVFFATAGGGRISHVGMYIGYGEFIHSASWLTGVMIDSMYDPYYVRTYVTARRVI